MGDILKFERIEHLEIMPVMYDGKKTVGILASYVHEAKPFEVTAILAERGFTNDCFDVIKTKFPSSNLELVRNREELLSFCGLDIVDVEALRLNYIRKIQPLHP